MIIRKTPYLMQVVMDMSSTDEGKMITVMGMLAETMPPTPAVMRRAAWDEEAGKGFTYLYSIPDTRTGRALFHFFEAPPSFASMATVQLVWHPARELTFEEMTAEDWFKVRASQFTELEPPSPRPEALVYPLRLVEEDDSA